MYDRIVEVALKSLGYRPIADRDYGGFATMMDAFRKDVRDALQVVQDPRLDVSKVTTWERLDAYLWLLGHLVEFRKRERKGNPLDGLNREVRNLYQESPPRFARLEPPAPR